MAQDSLATRLYHGEISYDFIGHRRIWYAASGLVLLISILCLAFRGLNPSIDFKGGSTFQFGAGNHSISQVTSAVQAAGVDPEVVQIVGRGGDRSFLVETKVLTQTGPNDQVAAVERSISSRLGVPANQIDNSSIGSTWGSQITQKAILGLVVFLLAVIIYLSARFEWRMAIAAIVALLHDLVITAGIYSLSGLEVSPSTVIALLTILGYSLYDTVVVFDKVRENTAGIVGGSRMTFSQAANLAVNQTLVRSINTSVIALLPVIGLLVIGAGLLGAGSLKDLAVALLIGLAAGAYSSIFIATPLLCDIKEREPAYRALAKRVAARQGKEARAAALEPATVGAPLGATDRGDGSDTGAATASAASAASTTAPSSAPGSGARPVRPPQRSKSSRPGGRGAKSRKRR